jgi:tetratricopeptide (TPR) repeat protein
MNRFLLVVFIVFLNAFALYAFPDSVSYYIQRNDLVKAKRIADMEAVKNKSSHFTWYQRAEVYFLIAKDKKKKNDIGAEEAMLEACRCIQKAVLLSQQTGKVSPAYINRLVRCHDEILEAGNQSYLRQDYDRAYVYFEKAIELTSLLSRVNKKILFDTIAIFNQALVLEKTGNTEGAKKKYLQLISLKYHIPELYSNLAFIYRTNGEYANAMKTLEDGLKLFPTNRYLLADWVNVGALMGRQQEILNSIKEKALQQKNNADLYFILASLYDNMNMTLDAEYYYKKTFEVDTGYVEAKYNLAVMYYNLAMEKNKQLNNIDRNSELFKNTLSDRNFLLKKSEQMFKQVQRINVQEVEKILRNISKMLS